MTLTTTSRLTIRSKDQKTDGLAVGSRGNHADDWRRRTSDDTRTALATATLGGTLDGRPPPITQIVSAAGGCTTRLLLVQAVGTPAADETLVRTRQLQMAKAREGPARRCFHTRYLYQPFSVDVRASLPALP